MNFTSQEIMNEDYSFTQQDFSKALEKHENPN